MWICRIILTTIQPFNSIHDKGIISAKINFIKNISLPVPQLQCFRNETNSASKPQICDGKFKTNKVST